MIDERRTRQRERAYDIAYDLAGERVTHGIFKAILSLVEADERTDIPVEPTPQRAAGARQVLQKKPAQEGLW